MSSHAHLGIHLLARPSTSSRAPLYRQALPSSHKKILCQNFFADRPSQQPSIGHRSSLVHLSNNSSPCLTSLLRHSNNPGHFFGSSITSSDKPRTQIAIHLAPLLRFHGARQHLFAEQPSARCISIYQKSNITGFGPTIDHEQLARTTDSPTDVQVQ